MRLLISGVYHSSTGSSVSVERVFSGGRDALSIRRYSLSAETLRTVMLFRNQLLRERNRN